MEPEQLYRWNCHQVRQGRLLMERVLEEQSRVQLSCRTTVLLALKGDTEHAIHSLGFKTSRLEMGSWEDQYVNGLKSRKYPVREED